MGFIRTLVITAAVIFAAVYFGSNYLVASALEKWLGVNVSVGSVRWGLVSHKLILKNVQFSNPEGYPDRKFVKISKIQAEYDAGDLRKGIVRIQRLEVLVDEVYLNKKSAAEMNVLELKPLQAVLGNLSEEARSKPPMISFLIDKVQFRMNRVFFETQLGNDRIQESRFVESPAVDLTELNTPDRVAVYGVLLALRSAGWQSFLPTREQVAQSAENQLGVFLEQFKQKAQDLQVQIQQTLNEKLKTAS